MLRYEVLNQAGDVVRTVEEEDHAMRPALLAGESLRLARDGNRAAVAAEPLKLSDADRAALLTTDSAAEARAAEPAPDHHDGTL